jgi:hypothetical protein
MYTRRTILAFGICTPLVRAKQVPKYRVGDWVVLASLPPLAYYEGKNQDLIRHAAILRACFKSQFQIVYVGEDGRPELDVTAAVARGRNLVGCSISIEPEFLKAVA